MASTSKRKSASTVPAENGQLRHLSLKRRKLTQTVKIEDSALPTEHAIAAPKPVVTESVYRDITFIFVGPNMVKFNVHLGILQRFSTFFKDVLADGVIPNSNTFVKDALADGVIPNSNVAISTVDGGTKAIYLKDEDPAIFKRFNDWAYTQRVTTGTEKSKDLPWTLLIDLYVFAEKRGIPAFQNTCINVIIGKRISGGPFPGQDIITPLWMNHGQGWQLRRLILDFFATSCNLKVALTQNTAYPRRFLHDVVVVLYERKVAGEDEVEIDWWKERAKYHVYTLDNPIALD